MGPVDTQRHLFTTEALVESVGLRHHKWGSCPKHKTPLFVHHYRTGPKAGRGPYLLLGWTVVCLHDVNIGFSLTVVLGQGQHSCVLFAMTSCCISTASAQSLAGFSVVAIPKHILIDGVYFLVLCSLKPGSVACTK